MSSALNLSSPCAGLSRLRDLNLQACRNITTAPGEGLPGLLGLTALTALNLRGCDNLADGALAPLTALTALQALDLSGCQKLTGAGCGGSGMSGIVFGV